MTDARASWEAKAEEWDRWVGEDGDNNRRFQSDPVLWALLGEVRGLDVLDAGCGTGYLSVRLARAGARVRGIDWAERMVAVARRNADRAGVTVDLAVDDCATLATVPAASVDRITSNYVLMDAPDLDGCARAFARVLRPEGRAVVVITHPCFDPPDVPTRRDDGALVYAWTRSYFERWAGEQRWGPFESPFVFHHRALGDYWRTFRDAGLAVVDLVEPVVSSDPPPGLDPQRWAKYRLAPQSLALVLRPAATAS